LVRANFSETNPKQSVMSGHVLICFSDIDITEVRRRSKTRLDSIL
jgi:hypothetical protein